MRRQKREEGHCRWRTVALVVTLAGAGLLGACGDGASGNAAAAGTNGGGAPTDSANSAVAAPALGENTPAGANGAPAGPRRVVLLGTSLTAGLGLPPEQAYPALLQEKADSAQLPVTIVNAGLSGETSAGAVRRAAWVLEQPAAVVVLEVGANDGLRGVDPDSTYANLVKLVQMVKAQRPEAKVALVQMEAPTNLGASYTRRFHDAYGRAARETGVPLWPFLLDGVAGVARLNQGDGIHPNAEGARVVAGTVWGAMGPLLRELVAP
ncbi:arylesterase [Gemmatimonas sp.]|uniref:arylesterase n=1 Tax=Gemmatimonas sp. TaxID=1962908 RepID=UPI0037C0BF38